MKYDDESFIEGVNRAYDILWGMFKSSDDKKSCEWDTEKEQKLLNIINKIDGELGR